MWPASKDLKAILCLENGHCIFNKETIQECIERNHSTASSGTCNSDKGQWFSSISTLDHFCGPISLGPSRSDGINLHVMSRLEIKTSQWCHTPTLRTTEVSNNCKSKIVVRLTYSTSYYPNKICGLLWNG